MTALATSPFLTWPVGIASLIATTTVSPSPAYRRLLPPSTRMTSARRAPELSAMRRMLSCWTMLLRPLHDLGHPPVHRLGQRPRFHDPHRVPRLGVELVPRLDLLGPGHLLAVDRMGVAAHQGDGHRLLHLVAGDHTHPDFAPGAGGRRLFGHVYFFSFRIVLIRAISRRMARNRIGFSIDSVAERNRSRNRSSVSSVSLDSRSSCDISRSSLDFTD